MSILAHPFSLTLFLFACFFTNALAAEDKIMLGIDVLENAGFKAITGKRIGLLTHPAGVNRDGKSTIDVLRYAPKVKLVALFGPEHGIYGDEKANIPVDDKIDTRTGLPVYSLYGKYRKPTAKMLAGLDVLIVDLQDLGVRSYTYVSCMRYAMEACFENNVEMMVLDRPNPIGGLKVDGPIMEERWMSYVGAFQIPYVHGLTIGELARFAKNTPGCLKVADKIRESGKLTIIPMTGWRRSMLWKDTGLNWVATSPAIPDVSAAVGYSMTGLGAQLGGFTHGYGTNWPFRLLVHKTKSADAVCRALKNRKIAGLDFRVLRYKNPYGEPKEGVYVYITNWEILRPTEVSFHMMTLAAEWEKPNPFNSAKTSDQDLFNKHVGSTAWWNEISTRGTKAKLEAFLAKSSEEAFSFRERSKAFHIYP